MGSRSRRGAFGMTLVAFCLLPSACSFLRSLDDLPCHQDTECTEGRCDEQAGVCEPCPAEMRLERFANGTAFCIDQFEVTQEQYWAFLQGMVGGVGRDHDLDPETCGTNFSYDPNADGCTAGFAPSDTASATLPVVCIDFCDALAFCASEGKRLCGARGGQRLRVEQAKNLDFDEWLLACSDGSASRATDKDTVYYKECNVNVDAPAEVGSHAGCHTDAWVFDIVGNVSEWVNTCGIANGEFRCGVLGGSFRSMTGAESGCVVVSAAHRPSERSDSTGARCCLD